MEVKAEVTAVHEILEDTGGKGRKGKRGLENTSQTGKSEGSHSKHQLPYLDKGHLSPKGEKAFFFFFCQIKLVERKDKTCTREHDPVLEADRKWNPVRKHQLDPVVKSQSC